MARLLICRNCGTMNRMRDYDGDPNLDMELREVIDRHIGQAQDKRPESHLAHLMRIDDDDVLRLDVESEVQKQMQEAGVFIRETRDDLKVEALKCFSRHNRPKGACPDWRDTSKIIGRKTGVAPEDRQYLCDFCPVKEFYVHKDRVAKGAYDG